MSDSQAKPTPQQFKFLGQRLKSKDTTPLDSQQQSITTLGIQSILEAEFDSTALSEVSLSSLDSRRGFDLSWYEDNHFTLYVSLTMDPLDIRASSDDLVFTKELIEATIQQSFETAMSKVKALDRCFYIVKASGSKPQEKIISIPLKVVMKMDDKDRNREITIEACPPQLSKNAVTRETMKDELIKLQAKFPVVYKESYKRKDEVSRFWVCSLQQENPFDEVLCLSVEFQISYNEEKIDKRTMEAWKLIHAWMKEHHSYDLNDEMYEKKLVVSRQTTAQIQHRVTQPRFYITFNAKDIECLAKKVYVLGMLHGKTIRLTAKQAPMCDSGFDFKFYCTLFDPKITTPRPSSLKATIEKVFVDLTPQTSPEAMIKTFLLSRNIKAGVELEWLKQCKELQIIQDIEKTVLALKEEGFLQVNHSAPSLLILSPLVRPWREIRLRLEDQSVYSISHKDCGIWIDRACGLPEDQLPLRFKCFSIHVALSYSALARTRVTPYQLEEFMQHRCNHFKIAHEKIVTNNPAIRALERRFTSSLEAGKGCMIDPDGTANPAFWSSISVIQDISENVGNISTASLWSFLFLPIEFQQFNYLVINAIDLEDSDDSSRIKTVKPAGSKSSNYFFISEKPKANTITLLYQGDGASGHFSSLLLPHFKNEEIKKKIISRDTIKIKFLKIQEALWEPIAEVFRDLSLEDFINGNRPEVIIKLPPDNKSASAAAVNNDSGQSASAVAANGGSGQGASVEVIHIDCDSQSQSANAAVVNGSGSQSASTIADNDGNGESPITVVTSVDNSGQPQGATNSQKPKRLSKLDKKIEIISTAITAIHDSCNRADEFSLFVPEELSVKQNTAHIRSLNELITAAQRSLKDCPVAGDDVKAANAQIFQDFHSLEHMIQAAIDLRNKFHRAIELSRRIESSTPKAKGVKGGKSTTSPESPAVTPASVMDLFFRVQSVVPADDISEQLVDGSLLSLFTVEPTPTCSTSLYLSILSSASAPSIIEEMRPILQREIVASKAAASTLCQETRAQFAKVEDSPMMKNGKTFKEYLHYKKVSSWDKIGFDNVLGEISLCSQVWKLNIALLWHRENTWRLFVSAYGGSSPILTILLAKTKVIADSNGFPIFAPGIANRFFPLFPLSETWFEDERFTPTTPDSIKDQEQEHPEIQKFQKYIDKEFILQSTVEHEGDVSSDEDSVITTSEFFNSFVDDDSVSQGSLPTPPGIAEVSIAKKVQIINEFMAKPLQAIVRRRIRIVESDSECENLPPSTTNNGGAAPSE